MEKVSVGSVKGLADQYLSGKNYIRLILMLESNNPQLTAK
jgi:hypothetical protein